MLGLRKALITGAVSVALVAGGTAAGAAIASGPVDNSGVIHGCWTNAAINGTHVFVLQDAGTSCPRGTTAISWNQSGPAGPTGATGPAGAAGPIGNTGPAGPAGAPGPTGPAGPQGPIGDTGPPGSAGANGNTVLNGTGAPASTVGNDGDFYIDTAADVLYGPRANGTWPATGTSLIGSPGTTGPAGPAGSQGPAGPQGAPGASIIVGAVPVNLTCGSGMQETTTTANQWFEVSFQGCPTLEVEAGGVPINLYSSGTTLLCPQCTVATTSNGPGNYFVQLLGAGPGTVVSFFAF